MNNSESGRNGTAMGRGDDVEDVPSWKGRRGRLAAAREWRRKTFEDISVGRARSVWFVGDDRGVVI